MVSIHRPLGYGPSTLPLRHSALCSGRWKLDLQSLLIRYVCSAYVLSLMHRRYSQIKLQRKPLQAKWCFIEFISKGWSLSLPPHKLPKHVGRQTSNFMRALGILQKTQTWASKLSLFMAVVGFEPTPPERLEPKSSALDHSATLPHKPHFCVLVFVSISQRIVFCLLREGNTWKQSRQ